MAAGPLFMPVDAIMFLVAVIVTLAAAWIAGGEQRTQATDTLFVALAAGVLVARAVFVVQWLGVYAAAPWTMFDPRDGGFNIPAGVAAGALLLLYRAWRKAALRRPLAIGAASGVLSLAILSGLPRPGGVGNALPDVAVRTLEGRDTRLAKEGAGMPLVVNLWASWCPPCRREMPVLAAAQRGESDVRFLFVNQGEDPGTIRRYLSSVTPAPSGVLVDGDSAVAHATAVEGFPTTLFYDTSGRLVDTHAGELSAATLAAKLATLRDASKSIQARSNTR